METVETMPVGRWQSVRTVARNPLLARSLCGLFAFAITEQGCWLAILLFAFDRGGVGGLAAVNRVPRSRARAEAEAERRLGR